MKNINNENKIELLAPAGSYEAFIAAINAGANAVYMGVDKFNARMMTKNFTLEEYIKCIDYAHKRDVKVYLTLNTLLKTEEIKEALETVCMLYEAGLDAVIVQDLGLAMVIHKALPDMPLHASTQMSVLSLEHAKYLESLGFKRVVLGRELDTYEIKEIVDGTNLEIEIFVHGALCVSVSGQCLASRLIGSRSANRGSCAQPCRMEYSLYNKNQLVVDNTYILSKKDIYGLEHIKKLKDIGVTSFKIEGRNKSIEYVAGVTRRYRSVIDNSYNIKDKYEKELLQLFNRGGKSYGYLDGVKYKSGISYKSPKNMGLILGKVLDIRKNFVKVKLEEDIDMHDGIEILSKNQVVSTIVTCIRDEKFNIVNSNIKKGSIVYIGDINKKVEIGSVVYKTSSSKLNECEYNYIKINKRLDYDVYVKVKENEKLEAISNNLSVTLDHIPEESIKNGLTKEKIIDVFSKTEDTSVRFKNIQIDLGKNIFVPISKLNELRRNIVEKIEESKCIRNNIDNMLKEKALELVCNKIRLEDKNSMFVYNFNPHEDYLKVYFSKTNKRLDRIYIAAKDYIKYKEEILELKDKVDVYFVVPNVILKNMQKYIIKNLEDLIKDGVKGIVLGNLGMYEYVKRLKEKYNITLVGDYYLNITNTYTTMFLDALDYVTPLFEEDIDVENINKYVNVECVEGVVTAMTTRYCMLASFVANKEMTNTCNIVCTKGEYKIKDKFNKEYNLVTDNTDCITQIVRNKPKGKGKNDINIRLNILK